MTALEGIRVLDVSQFESGPGCAQQLAWLGAEVVKIEDPRGGDGSRTRAEPGEDALFFVVHNHNKKSVCLDLRSPEGRELFLRLVPRFDVVVENFAFGVVEKLGIDYAMLSAIHPGLIYASIKGFGLTGRHRHLKALDPIGQAAGGLTAITGERDGPPVKAGAMTADHLSGLNAVIGILAACLQRAQTGKGQLVEISMQEAVANSIRTTFSSVDDYERDPIPRRGNRITPPTDLYPCAPLGPTDFVQVAAFGDHMWVALTDLIGKPWLRDDPRFADRPARLEHGDALHEEISQWTRQRTKHEAMAEIGAAGVPVSALYDNTDLFADAHLRERGFIRTVHHANRGEMRVLASAVRMADSPVEITPAPLLGEHTREVLEAELGLDPSTLERLYAAGVIGCAPASAAVLPPTG